MPDYEKKSDEGQRVTGARKKRRTGRGWEENRSGIPACGTGSCCG